MGLRLSRFNIPIEIEGKPQLFNTRSQRLLSGGMTRKLVERGLDGLSLIERKILHGNGMVLLDEGDEGERLYVEYMRGKQRSTLFSLIVVPAYRCNCACPDCFQREYDHRTAMSEAVRLGVVRLFEHAIVERRAPSPVLWISGGEPFANVRACIEISSGCREAASRHRVKLTQAITTNATLTRTPLGRRLAQQTDLFYVGMAASESAQAAERPYAGGGNSYRDAIRGIGDMAEVGRKVTVRFNISGGAAGI
ncbi:MAG: 4Fe-4S cluster-binding domain-containing protein, partial [Candidatus Thiodiazotropha sp.]